MKRRKEVEKKTALREMEVSYLNQRSATRPLMMPPRFQEHAAKESQMRTTQFELHAEICSVFRSPRATRWSALSHWVHDIQVSACRFTGMSGLAFALATGSLSGIVINASIGLYRALGITAPYRCWRDEAARRFYVLRARTLRVFISNGQHGT
jgi:hypothetical protein